VPFLAKLINTKLVLRGKSRKFREYYSIRVNAGENSQRRGNVIQAHVAATPMIYGFRKLSTRYKLKLDDGRSLAAETRLGVREHRR
jgi:hypothetical protein